MAKYGKQMLRLSGSLQAFAPGLACCDADRTAERARRLSSLGGCSRSSAIGTLLTGEAAEKFAHDATFIGHDLEAVVHPAGSEEVAALVRGCAEEGTRSWRAGHVLSAS